jgi:hypothetical protein
METTLTVYEIFIIGGSILGTYIKMVVEQSKIRTRLEFLEDGRDEIRDILAELVKDMQEIKLLLAKNQITK